MSYTSRRGPAAPARACTRPRLQVCRRVPTHLRPRAGAATRAQTRVQPPGGQGRAPTHLHSPHHHHRARARGPARDRRNPPRPGGGARAQVRGGGHGHGHALPPVPQPPPPALPLARPVRPPPPASDPARRWATPPPRGRRRPPGLLPASIGEGSGGAEPALYMKGRGRRGARLLCAPWAPLCSPRRCSRPCPRSLPHPPHAAPQRGRAHPDHPGAAGHGARPGPARAAHRGLDLSPPLARPPARHGPREGQGRRRQLEEIHLELGEEGAAGPHRRQLV